MTNHDAMTNLLEKAVLRAAGYISTFFAQKQTVTLEYKQDQSMVMNIDLESERLFLETLGTTLPVVCEEDPASHSLINTARDYFLVDPLDGTASAKRFRGQPGGQVGYGPLGGYVRDGRLYASAFYNVPQAALFTAIAGSGVYCWRGALDGVIPPIRERERLTPIIPPTLRECGVLFFPSVAGEARHVEELRRRNAIENVYRFGGCANDCSRLCLGEEQIQIQFSAKPWDFSAALLSREAGYDVIVDPFGRRVDFDSWEIEKNNPILTVPPQFRAELFSILDRAGI